MEFAVMFSAFKHSACIREKAPAHPLPTLAQFPGISRCGHTAFATIYLSCHNRATTFMFLSPHTHTHTPGKGSSLWAQHPRLSINSPPTRKPGLYHAFTICRGDRNPTIMWVLLELWVALITQGPPDLQQVILGNFPILLRKEMALDSTAYYPPYISYLFGRQTRSIHA